MSTDSIKLCLPADVNEALWECWDCLATAGKPSIVGCLCLVAIVPLIFIYPIQYVRPSLAMGGGRTKVDTSPLVVLNVYLNDRIETTSVKFLQSMVQSRFLGVVSP